MCMCDWLQFRRFEYNSFIQSYRIALSLSLSVAKS